MRAGPVALVALFAALVGGGAVLGIGKATGWFRGTTRTVFVTETAPATPTSGPVVSTVKPLLGNGFDPARIYATRSPGVVTVYALFDTPDGRAAQGSGFVVSRGGLILTNAHVITDAGESVGPVRAARQIYVEFGDRDRIPARIVGWDLFDDVGVLRVDSGAHSLVSLPLGESSTVRVGEPVAAIGSPFGNENSLAVGVVSAIHRAIGSLTSNYDLVDAIQIDAPINHGSSGGPLFDAAGRVIGINAQIRSVSGTAEGVGFVVPIDSARRSLNQLVATGSVAYAYIGVTSEDLTPTLARHLGYPVARGALVDSVIAGGPAAKAGLRGGGRHVDFDGQTVLVGGDVIVAIGDSPVTSAEDVGRIVGGRLSPGQKVSVEVIRAGRRSSFEVRLGVRPLSPDGTR